DGYGQGQSHHNLTHRATNEFRIVVGDLQLHSAAETFVETFHRKPYIIRNLDGVGARLAQYTQTHYLPAIEPSVVVGVLGSEVNARDVADADGVADDNVRHL